MLLAALENDHTMEGLGVEMVELVSRELLDDLTIDVWVCDSLGQL